MNKLVLVASLVILLACVPALAQEHAQPKPADAGHVDAPATEYQRPEAEHAGEHGMLSALLWPTVNFVILVGALWWFLKQPISVYLTDRHQSIRKDLVEAANVRAAAAAQLAERERMLEQTRREIDLQVRLAKRELVEHAANLSVQLARDRIEKTITPDDHERLV